MIPVDQGICDRVIPLRPIPALAIAALVLKVLIVLLQWTVFRAGVPPAVDYLDRGVNLLVIVLAAIWVYRLRAMARAGLLWRVSRKLVLSYILIGAVPILLLVTFALLAFLLIFFDVSSYLVRNRLTALTEQATTFARTTLFELERLPAESRLEIVERRQAALATPVPRRVGCGRAAPAKSTARRNQLPGAAAPQAEPLSSGEWRYVPPPDILPGWVGCEGFGGLVLHDSSQESVSDLRMVARGVAVPQIQRPGFAVVVDMPLGESMGRDVAGGDRHHAGKPACLFALQHGAVRAAYRLGDRTAGNDRARHERGSQETVRFLAVRPDWQRD